MLMMRVLVTCSINDWVHGNQRVRYLVNQVTTLNPNGTKAYPLMRGAQKLTGEKLKVT
jgi:hypothetical protein